MIGLTEKKSCKKEKKDILKKKLLGLFRKQRSSKEKVMGLILKLVKRRKRQD